MVTSCSTSMSVGIGTAPGLKGGILKVVLEVNVLVTGYSATCLCCRRGDWVTDGSTPDGCRCGATELRTAAPSDAPTLLKRRSSFIVAGCLSNKEMENAGGRDLCFIRGLVPVKPGFRRQIFGF